ncbi:phage holin family protein [Membranicola marinus]|uniref:Phage holin family protein n=1 Tax=Membranihabitans marinus TaxID=1227546 RepID=A0A953HS58_9BACT|nr:phage holin family protein [Membranihabitans marinus]MBY5957276.1 phage holin family protein [Membranihabitans marinus]
MGFIIQLLLSAVVVFVLAWLLPGIEVASYGSAILVALVIGLLQLIVKPILVVLTLPITILTLGLFLIVINALLILLAGSIVAGFTVSNFWWAVLFSLLLSLFGAMYFQK